MDPILSSGLILFEGVDARVSNVAISYTFRMLIDGGKVALSVLP